MNILVIGGGGREHALVWKIRQNPNVNTIYCAPGNAGISQIASCVDIDVNDIKNLQHFAKKYDIHLTVVGPEAPLVDGIVDQFEEAGLPIFGPSKAAAALEGSKAYAKSFVEKYNIPSAHFATFDNAAAARDFIESNPVPIVVKADGLAAGKGAIVCRTREEALDAIEKIMVKRSFGEAGNKVVIEEFLEGEEASILALTDGDSYVCLSPAQDHKPIYDGDHGPNTGGMGAYAPAPVIDADKQKLIEEQLVQRTINGMIEEGRPYRGVLYLGLMITKDGPKLIEYNCRFGDPETQAVLPLLETDLVELMSAVLSGRLGEIKFRMNSNAAVCVVMASAGYPGSYEKGKPILGLDSEFDSNTVIFHAGTKLSNDSVLSNGGRVLGVTAVDNSIEKAIKKAYSAVGLITFDGAYYRKDIGVRALERIRRS